MLKKFYLLIAILLLTSQILNAQCAGNAIDFNPNYSMEGPASSGITSNFTMELWVNIDPATTINSFMSQSNFPYDYTGIGNQSYAVFPGGVGLPGTAGAGISVGSNGIAVIEHSDNYIPALLVYYAPLTGWTHITVVYNSNKPSLYINGVFKKEGLQSTRIVSPSPYLGDPTNYYGPFTSTVDEFKIWSAALSATTIANYYNKQTNSQHPYYNSLNRYYNFNTLSGLTVPDISGNNNNGTLSFSPVVVASGINITCTAGALNFDGINDNISIAHAASQNAFPLTASCWIKTSSTAFLTSFMNKYISGSSNGWRFGMQSGYLECYYIKDGNSYATVTSQFTPALFVADGNWHHVALVVDNSGAKLYVDGQQKTAVPWVGIPGGTTTTTPLLIGSYPSYNFFNGSIDEVEIWNRALCATEINTYRNASLPFTSGNNLVAYHKLNQGTTGADNTLVNQAHDEVTNTNNGTLNNFTLTGSTSNWVAGTVTGTASTYVAPTPVISASGPLSFCAGSSVTLTASAGASYLWSNGASTQSISASQAGNYSVTVKDISGCTGTSTATVVATTVCPPPVITSFTPISGGVGTTVTITGNNFDAVPQNNTVYIGGVKVPVVSGSSTSLNIVVPSGLSNAPITVTLPYGLSATSASTFNVVASCNGDITASSFEAPVIIKSTTYYSYAVATADLNGDGKQDLVNVNFYGTINVFKNIASPGSLTTASFATPLTLNNTNGSYNVRLGDMDGDGKPDIVITGNGGVFIHRNTSTGGNLSFAAYVQINTSSSSNDLVLADLNKDGKIDIVTAPYNYSGQVGNMVLLQNTSIPGSLSFSSPVNISNNPAMSNFYGKIEARDLDGDGYADLILAAYNGTSVYIYRNNGVQGNITAGSLSTYIAVPSTVHTTVTALADMNDDGKVDIVCSGYGGLSVVANNSTPGNVQFATPTLLNANLSAYDIEVVDINGDGLTDITGFGGAVFIMQRLSSGLSFANPVYYSVPFPYASYAGPRNLAVADLDGDGLTDFFVGAYNYDQAGISYLPVLRNTVAAPVAKTITAAGSTTFCEGNSVVLSVPKASNVNYQWKLNGSSTGDNSNQLTAVASGTYTVEMSNPCGTTASLNSIAVMVNAAPSVPVISYSGQLNVCEGTSVSLTSTAASSYQWKRNGDIISGAINQTFVASTSGNYSVTVPNNFGCTATSLLVQVIVNPKPLVAVSPASASICAGSPVVLTAAEVTTLTKTYNVGVGDLINMTQNCGNGSYYGYSGVGFKWDDTGTGTATSVTIKFTPGVECQSNTTHTTILNGVTGESFTSLSFCSCSIRSGIVTINPSNQAYVVGATNTLIFGNQTTWFGLNSSPVLNNYYATITVTYSIPASGNISWLWPSTSETTNNITVNPTANTNYSVTATNEFGCSSSAGATINMYTPAAVTVSAVGATNVCPGSQVQLTTTAVNGSGTIKSYQWLLSGEPLQGANSNELTASASGNYSVAVTNTNDCSTISNAISVSIEDLLSPEVHTRPLSVSLDHTGHAVITADQVNNNSTDNCSIESYSLSKSEFDCSNLGENTVTLTVTDVNGHTATGTALVTVTDDEDPEISLSFASGLFNISDDGTGNCTTTVNLGTPTTSDNCSIASLKAFITGEEINPATYTFPIGLTTINWIVTDGSGHTAMADQIIKVVDDEKPSISAPGPINVSCQDDNSPAATGTATGSDNCSAVTISYSDESTQTATGFSYYNYTITRTWTATDVTGNHSEASQIITVSDGLAPVLAGIPGNANAACNNVPSAAQPTATDNCDANPVVSLEETSTQTTTGFAHYNYTITRTWTATDITGNHASAQQIITVSDGVAPVLAGVPANVNAGCDNIPAAALPTATDNCDANPVVSLEEITIQTATGIGHYNYTITRTWTATDVSGNHVSASQIITVSDDVAPVLAGIPENVNAGCDNIPAAALPTATDNCDPSAVVSLLETSTQAATGFNHYNYTITRTWTATDVTGNHASASQTITVSDRVAPVLAGVPENTNASCDDIPAAALPTATDNCDPSPVVSLEETSTQTASGFTHYNYTITRTWTATDVTGNHASASQTITVSDEVSPVLAGVPGNVNAACDNIPAAALPTATDNCDQSPVVSLLKTSTQTTTGIGHYNYTITRTWTATDVTGNHASASQTITVSDEVAPVLAGVPANVNAGCDNIPEAALPTATDNCDANPVVSLEETSTQTASGFAHYNYTITRTWTATDVTGNHASASQMITVSDGVAPVLAGVPVNVNAACDNIPAAALPTATDNCDANPIVSLDETNTQTAIGIGHYNYTITRTWTATDVTGNQASASQTITVSDEFAPVLAGVPANANAVCDNIPAAAQPTATDNCDPNPAVSLSETSTQTSTGIGHYDYTITRTWTATDVTGNNASASQVITVSDGVAPVLASVPANANAACDNIPAAALLTATDNCDPNPVISLNEISTQTTTGFAHYNYTITRTWTATDVTWNHASASQIITVSDRVVPVLAGVPANANAGCDNIPAAVLPTATDNCDANPIVSLNETSTQTATGFSHYNYTTTRTWTATDVTGNHASASQIITVSDEFAPVLAGVPGNVNAGCDNIPAAALPTATDNCDANPVVSLEETSIQTVKGIGHYNYTITRTWTATDVTGNQASASQTITVSDEFAPVLAGVPADANAGCDNIPAAVLPTATDNCDPNPIVSLNETSTQTATGFTHSNYTITRTWTATDVTANHSSASQIITVSDGMAPVLAGVPSDANASCDNIPAAALPTATDNCDENPVVNAEETSTQTATGIGHYNYTITRTWTATDVTGNHANASQMITVSDGVAPVIAGVPADANAACDNIPAAASPTATDNCDTNPVVSLSETSTQTATGIGHYNYTITRTWTATDVTGNHASASQTITVSDGVAPALAGVPADVNAGCDNIPAAASPTANDNCDPSPVVSLSETSTQTTTDFGHYNYTITRTWTATDVTGNHSSELQTITVSDEFAPLLAGVPENTNASCDNVPAAALPTATDNCDPNPVVSLEETSTQTANGHTHYHYSITRTWTATDVTGNYASASQTITVSDDVAPVLAGVPGNVDAACDNIPAAALPTTKDNCDANPVVSLEETSTQTAAGFTHYNYTITRKWTATDVTGNHASASQTITVSDVVAPVLAGVPNDINAACDNIPAAALPTATDNCDANHVVSLNETSSQTATGFAHYNYTITRTWTATDVTGNYSSASQTITVSDQTAPIAKCKTISVTLINGIATITPSDVDNGSFDNCSPVTLSLSKTIFNCTNIGANNVVLTVKDISNNTSQCVAIVNAIGEVSGFSITSMPATNVYTGGISTNIFLGYGPQNTTLRVNTPASGEPYSYLWTGNALSNYYTSSPVFTPATAGTFTFTVRVTNRFGCTTTCSITICVTDIRVMDKKGVFTGKVFVCHFPNGIASQAQTLEISATAVPTHLSSHTGDRLGSCNGAPCGTLLKNNYVEESSPAKNLDIVVAPNPSISSFKLKLISNSAEPIYLKVINAKGQAFERMDKLYSGSTVTLGAKWIGGTYFVEALQGGQRKMVRLVKLN